MTKPTKPASYSPILDTIIILAVASIAYGGYLIAPAVGFLLGGGLALVLALGVAVAGKRP